MASKKKKNENNNLKKKKGIISRIKSFLFPHKPSEKMEDDNEEEFSYLDDDNDKMYTLFSKTTSVDKIKINKVQDYYDLFVSMLKIEDKKLHTDEHLWVLGIDKTGYSVCAYIVILGYANFFKVDPTRLFKTALQHDSVKIIIAQSKPDAETLSVTPSDLDLTNIVYHKSEILGIELVDHIVISNLSIHSKTPLYYSHLENGAIYFVQNDMTHKSYKDIKPELDEARNEYGADQKKKGLVEGEAKGKQEGERNKAIKIAENLLKNNVDINIIISSTGLTVKDIFEIKGGVNYLMGVAKKMLKANYSVEDVSDIVGFTIEAIEKIKKDMGL